MYSSPIEAIYGEMSTQMVQEDENLVLKAIRNVKINVDKDELIKALQYDRNQYTTGYKDGRFDTIDEIRSGIEQSIKNHDEFADYGRVYGLQIALDIIDKCEEVSKNV